MSQEIKMNMKKQFCAKQTHSSLYILFPYTTFKIRALNIMREIALEIY